ncbi:hypothetical protein Bca52824_067089 [Brassica carinata]|uniref:Uncharacterized protein n=1 Tax=Brassica carinata TaxID=52824 RepID=A0A8X7UBI8_BRACI|nr:hypothetical protein Bca52824_067089 [Brassica carinata]
MKLDPELKVPRSGARLEDERESETVEGETLLFVVADGEEEVERFAEEAVVDEAVDESVVEEDVWELCVGEEEGGVVVLAEEESSLEEEVDEVSVVAEGVVDERCVDLFQVVGG